MENTGHPQPLGQGPRLQKGEVVELTTTNLAFGGAGIAKIGDFVVFVAGAVPGDTVKARITKNKRRYAEARVEEMVTPSPDRRPARCPVFGICGGCLWQDLDYEIQLRYKAAQVRESLEHLGGIKDFELASIAGMDDPWRYRNRADFSIGQTNAGAVVGFRPRGRWDSVLSLSECHLLAPIIEGIRATVEQWLRDSGIPGWDPRSNTGFARHLLVRSAQGGKEAIVSLATAEEELPKAWSLVERLHTAHPEVVGVVHALNKGRAEISSGLPFETLWGRPFLLERAAGVVLKVSVDAFFQTNTSMAQTLYGLVAREAGLAGVAGETSPGCAGPIAGSAARGPVVWDLYSGVGSIGLALARKEAAGVLGIEAVRAAVADARENARLNGMDNVRFVEGDVAKVLREAAEGDRRLPQGLETPDVIVVDPPRAGLSDKTISRIGEIGAPRIVYVSCNPATMAPNVARLADHGYHLDRVTPVDMFPHTPHVEAVGLLNKVGQVAGTAETS
jgi:23S rRNA (uracil1939-C5)-methyltransferase